MESSGAQSPARALPPLPPPGMAIAAPPAVVPPSVEAPAASIFDGPSPLAAGPVGELVEQIGGILVGDNPGVRLAIAGFLAGGHILLEDQPGVGKTLLAKAIARSLGGTFGRVQATPDLLPSDLTGVSIWDEQQRTWSFQPGPLFNNVVLIDELNRATPRSQSALLEAMAEHQVTVDGTTYPLPDPFLVIATQNPHGDELGTFPLVAGQRDRFTVTLSLGLPGHEAERRLLRGVGGDRHLDALEPVAGGEEWQRLRRDLDDVHVAESVLSYVLDVMEMIRFRAGPQHQASPRASLMLLRMSRAVAVVAGRDHVTPDDVRSVTVAVLAHRLVDVIDGDLSSARQWVASQLALVPVPPVRA